MIEVTFHNSQICMWNEAEFVEVQKITHLYWFPMSLDLFTDCTEESTSLEQTDWLEWTWAQTHTNTNIHTNTTHSFISVQNNSSLDMLICTNLNLLKINKAAETSSEFSLWNLHRSVYSVFMFGVINLSLCFSLEHELQPGLQRSISRWAGK